MSHDSYIAACVRENAAPSEVFRSPGLTIQHVAIDSMHAGDLGAFQDALGSLLWLEVNNRQWRGSREVKIARLNRELRAYYAANAARNMSKVSEITYPMIFCKSVGYPYLKAKAAQTRHLADFGLAIAYRHLNGSTDRPPLRFARGHALHGKHEEHLRLTVTLFEGMVGYHRACGARPFDPAACKSAMYDFLRSVSALHTLWRRDVPERDLAAQPWHMRPKTHILQHLVEEQTLLWGSPSRAWCYRDEDFVGSVKQIACKSKHPANLEKLVTDKMMLLSGLGARL